MKKLVFFLQKKGSRALIQKIKFFLVIKKLKSSFIWFYRKEPFKDHPLDSEHLICLISVNIKILLEELKRFLKMKKKSSKNGKCENDHSRSSY